MVRFLLYSLFSPSPSGLTLSHTPLREQPHVPLGYRSDPVHYLDRQTWHSPPSPSFGSHVSARRSGHRPTKPTLTFILDIFSVSVLSRRIYPISISIHFVKRRLNTVFLMNFIMARPRRFAQLVPKHCLIKCSSIINLPLMALLKLTNPSRISWYSL